VTIEREIGRLVAACRESLQLGDALGDEYSYAHLSLCVLDAVYSIGVRYESTRAVVQRYAEWAHLTPTRATAELPPRESQQPLSALVDQIADLGPDRFAADVVQNRQRTSTRNGVLKAEAVMLFAGALGEHGVGCLQDIAPVATDKDLDAALRAVAGQGSGISIAYFFMLAGDDNLVKPDRMLQRFVSRVLGRPVAIASIQALVSGACRELRDEHPHLSPRALDHAIWDHERSAANR
jgi:hypothetical protein